MKERAEQVAAVAGLYSLSLGEVLLWANHRPLHEMSVAHFKPWCRLYGGSFRDLWPNITIEELRQLIEAAISNTRVCMYAELDILAVGRNGRRAG
jgi:hypothetical protein